MHRFTAFAVLLILGLGAARAQDGYKPLFNGKDLTGWFNVNCAPRHVLCQGQHDYHLHRQSRSGYLRAPEPPVRKLHPRIRMVSTPPIRKAPSAIRASSSGATRFPPSAPATRAPSKCKSSSIFSTRIRKPASRPRPATAISSASGAAKCKPDRPYPTEAAERCIPSEKQLQGGIRMEPLQRFRQQRRHQTDRQRQGSLRRLRVQPAAKGYQGA